MSEVHVRKLRHEFIAEIAHHLAAEGVRHWQGPAAFHPTAPRARLICITPDQILQDLVVCKYQAGVVQEKVELVRIKLNFGYSLPVRLQNLDCKHGRPLELTCIAADLPVLLPHAVALLLGQTAEKKAYAWERRAAETLLPETRQRLQAMDLLSVATLPNGNCTRLRTSTGGWRRHRFVPFEVSNDRV